MIINITEEQKRAIESCGCMVIEFKKQCYDAAVTVSEAIVNAWDAIKLVVHEVAEKIVILAANLTAEKAREFEAIIFNEVNMQYEKKHRFRGNILKHTEKSASRNTGIFQ